MSFSVYVFLLLLLLLQSNLHASENLLGFQFYFVGLFFFWNKIFIFQYHNIFFFTVISIFFLSIALAT